MQGNLLKRYAGLGCMLGAALTSSAVAAQTSASRPMRVLVPYAAGGSTDTLMRMVGQKLAETNGQSVVIDNRPGGGTLIATEIVARAEPDGTTLLMATPAFAVAPALFAKLPFDTRKDFVAVTNVAATSNILAVPATQPAQSVREFIALAKANPGKYTYGSSGIGGAAHLAAELFRSMAGIDVVHVPYKGGSVAVTDLLAGRLNFMLANLTTAQPHLKSGRLRALGIGTDKRSVIVPDVPTIAESGLPGYEANNWNGVVVPRGTPAAIVDRLQREIVRALAAPEVHDKLLAAAFEPVGSSPAQFARYLESERVKWGRVVTEASIKPE